MWRARLSGRQHYHNRTLCSTDVYRRTVSRERLREIGKLSVDVVRSTIEYESARVIDRYTSNSASRSIVSASGRPSESLTFEKKSRFTHAVRLTKHSDVCLTCLNYLDIAICITVLCWYAIKHLHHHHHHHHHHHQFISGFIVRLLEFDHRYVAT